MESTLKWWWLTQAERVILSHSFLNECRDYDDEGDSFVMAGWPHAKNRSCIWKQVGVANCTFQIREPIVWPKREHIEDLILALRLDSYFDTITSALNGLINDKEQIIPRLNVHKEDWAFSVFKTLKKKKEWAQSTLPVLSPRIKTVLASAWISCETEQEGGPAGSDGLVLCSPAPTPSDAHPSRAADVSFSPAF